MKKLIEIKNDMIRPILFRGYYPFNNSWVYGNVLQDAKGAVQIVEPWEDTFFYYAVEPRSVQQYTGLTDSNCNQIYEGDIVKCKVDLGENEKCSFTAVVEFGNPNGYYDWGFQLRKINGDNELSTEILLYVEMEETGTTIEVVGNVYDKVVFDHIDKDVAEWADAPVLAEA